LEVNGQLYTHPPVEKVPGTCWIRGWVGPRAGLDDAEKEKILPLPGLEFISVGCPFIAISSRILSVYSDKLKKYAVL
jgi:hypothetical protein